ncbi:MAG: SGNH/GDSL hydrolase family protein [Deltaproteobacteria bacterium]|nr:SGNH/GDSL hydrolase family protein [Deltaproteobacteria bacterium]
MPDIPNTRRLLAEGRHVTIVALGDSNTQVSFQTQGRMNWTGLLEEALVETYGLSCCTFINSGRYGSTFVEAKNRLYPEVLRFSPDLVIVALGMNDALAGLSWLDEFVRHAEDVVSAILAFGEVEVLLRTPNPAINTHALPANAGKPFQAKDLDPPGRPLRAYSQALVELAKKMSLPVVDHYSLWEKAIFKDRSDGTAKLLWQRMGDSMHVNAQGHLAFFRELAPIFGVPQTLPWEEMDL